MIIGSLMLVKSPIPELRPGLRIVLPVALGVSLDRRLPADPGPQGPAPAAPSTGREGMIGETGAARTDLAPAGKVFVHGEIWEAEADGPVRAGRESPGRRGPRRLEDHGSPRSDQEESEHPSRFPGPRRRVHRPAISLNSIKILREYERGVIFRLGRVLPAAQGPGLILLFSPIDRMVKISLRLGHHGRPAPGRHHQGQRLGQGQRRHLLPGLRSAQGIIEVEDYLYATSQLAQTTLRSVLGQVELDDLLSKREKINQPPGDHRRSTPIPGGSRSQLVEVKHVDLPEDMQRAIAKQAEAERERRAKVIHADGEFQAADKLDRGRRHHRPGTRGPPAPLSADADRDRHGKELDDRLPAAPGNPQGLHVR